MKVIDKPWGYEQILITEPYVMKRLAIYLGRRLSLQYHRRKTETLWGLTGKPVVELWSGGVCEQTITLEPGQMLHVLPGQVHRISHLHGAVHPRFHAVAEILEVSTPELDDVVRIEDDYGRVL